MSLRIHVSEWLMVVNPEQYCHTVCTAKSKLILTGGHVKFLTDTTFRVSGKHSIMSRMIG